MSKLLDEIRDLFCSAAPSLFEKIRLFNETQNSYEEWLNWELYLILKGHGLRVVARPRYETNSFKKFADLLVSNDQQSALIEIKIAHSHTQEKYIWEIHKDFKALESVSDKNIEKALIMFLSSNYAQIGSDEAWQEWLRSSNCPSLETQPCWDSMRTSQGSDALYFVHVEG